MPAKKTYTDFTGDAVYNYLAHLAATGNKQEAAAVNNLSPHAINQRRKEDQAFADDEKWADEQFNDKIRSAMVRRGIDGVVEDVWYQGEVVGEKRVYSDAILNKLSQRLPDLNKEQKIELTTPGILAVPVRSAWDNVDTE